jgi:hypothetical protein
MTRWQCPGCGEQIAAKAVAVGHRCKARHNKITDWVEVEVTDDDRPPHGTGSQVGTAPIGGGGQAFDQGLSMTHDVIRSFCDRSRVDSENKGEIR